MLNIFDTISARQVLDQPLDPALRKIITDRLADAEAIGLGDQTHIVVIQPHDTEEQLERELGWSPLINPMSEVRYGEMGFEPGWSWLQDLGSWYEVIQTVGNSGYACILLVSKTEGAPSNLLALCAESCSPCN